MDNKLEYWDNVTVLSDDVSSVIKFVFTKKDAVAETVLYRYPSYEDRTVICHSVMSGCPMGCRFCGTGDFFIRNLTVEEMLEQIYFAIDYTKVKPSEIKKLQIMSMSMGEPMLNRRIVPLYKDLYDKFPTADLLVSTSGPDIDYNWFFGVASLIPTIGLQFSVHESTDEARDRLIPFKKKLTLEKISRIGLEFYHCTGRKPFFNYCAGEHNSSLEDASRLRKLFMPHIWEATVSVICEQGDVAPKTGILQRSLAIDFSSKLVDLGFNVRVFDPAGQDTIGGGCGQLWHTQKWVQDNAGKAKSSIGFGKDKVHTPQEIK